MLEFLWNILEILFFTKGRLFQKELLEFLIWAKTHLITHLVVGNRFPVTTSDPVTAR